MLLARVGAQSVRRTLPGLKPLIANIVDSLFTVRNAVTVVQNHLQK